MEHLYEPVSAFVMGGIGALFSGLVYAIRMGNNLDKVKEDINELRVEFERHEMRDMELYQKLLDQIAKIREDIAGIKGILQRER